MAGFAACSLHKCSSIAGTQLATPQRASLRPQPINVGIFAAQVLQGKVVSTAGEKTAVVAVENFRPHPLYQKAIRSTRKYVVHDEANTCTVGDLIEINPCRPISKRKRFTVGEMVKKMEEV